LNNLVRTFCKLWPVWAILLVVCVWPYFNDWAWDSAKAEAQSGISQFEVRHQMRSLPQASAPAPARTPGVEMSEMTCIAANSLFQPYWQMDARYRTKLIQAFVWHAYGRDIPSVQTIKDRGCGTTDDGKYLFVGD